MFNIKVLILVALTISMVQSCCIDEPEEVQCGCNKPSCPSCGCKSCGCGCKPRRCGSSCGCGCQD
ncbi:keratin-associated protein 5-9 [Drosophila eugracilis]|uniref:keratin-associated protein 5-9 n=1 Tax=Drosophila eugracilis TaxID=29029 RepID=UPI0007E80F7E|nr:keratin-associated protein 5-9 [Drosophila eugracilis]